MFDAVAQPHAVTGLQIANCRLERHDT
jgi:hypothetical protein